MTLHAIFRIIFLLNSTFSFKFTNFFASPLSRSTYLQSSPSLSSSDSAVDSFDLTMNHISTSYDSFIIDQWGVLHDGKNPYPGVIECLTRLKTEGKKLILLSNSSKRKENSFKGLIKVGIDASLFDDIVTSGDLAWGIIKERRFDFHIPVDDTIEKLKVFVIGNNQDDLQYIASCNCVLGSPENADFVLARGTFCFMTECNSPDIEKCGIIECDSAEQLVAESDYWLQRCMSRQIPMLVSNPDFSRPGSGCAMPGIIGKKYSDMGGLVQYVGKPYKAVYDTCFDLLTVLEADGGISASLPTVKNVLDKSKICMIGDSLDHDIRGAKNNGIASVWIANGVHAAEMGTSEGSSILVAENVLKNMYEKYGVTPTYTIASFK